MNFFQHQDQARSATRKLVVLFCLAVLTLIIATTFLVYGVVFYAGASQEFTPDIVFSEVFLQVSLGVIVIVILGSLFRLGQLRGGGHVVAESLGGKLLEPATRDPAEKKVLNVVEEMAIAAGMPVPPVFIMEDQGINAFAAGYHQKDAVVGVTRGCIEQLDRDELQGVIAHEFSHIYNGDMRLNIRLMGILYGIMVLGMIGYYLMRGSMYSYSRRDRKGGIIFLGLGLVIIGYGGTFFGNIIKSAVSRQREFLADASAVQFTRNPEGISGALKKIGGYENGSAITSVDTSEISHMLFEEGQISKLNNLFATHPPLDERIRRIDPHWTGSPGKKKKSFQQPETHAGVAGFAEHVPGSQNLPLTEQIVDSVGNPGVEHIDHASKQIGLIPAGLREAAHEPFSARALVHSLVVCASGEVADKQLDYLKQQFSEQEFRQFRAIYEAVEALPRDQFLPMLLMALPSLKLLTRAQYQTFMTRLSYTITADENISLFEWSLFSLIKSQLEINTHKKRRLLNLADLEKESVTLISSLAAIGNDKEQYQQAAFSMAVKELGAGNKNLQPEKVIDIKKLDEAIDRLTLVKPLQKPRLIKAMVRCVEADNVISALEGELLRSVALLLDCPLPPLLGKEQ